MDCMITRGNISHLNIWLDVSRCSYISRTLACRVVGPVLISTSTTYLVKDLTVQVEDECVSQTTGWKTPIT